MFKARPDVLACAILALGGSAFAERPGAESTSDPARLIELLASPDPVARREASWQLSNLGAAAKSAVPALIKALADSDKQVWSNAVTALARIGPDARDAVPALMQDLNSRNLTGLRQRFRDQTLVRTCFALSRIGADAVPALIEGLRGQDTFLRMGCARALGGMGPVAADAVPALIENLVHKDEAVQREAVEALGAIGPASKARLMEVLDWKEPHQRANAALALGAIGKGASDAAGPMLAKLKTESDPHVKASLITALPRIGADSAKLIPVLIDGLKSDREEFQSASVNSLLTMRAAQPQIVKALAVVVKEKDPAVSERATYVLGRIGVNAAPAVPAILDVATKSSPPSQTVLDALVQIGDPAVGPMLLRFEKADSATLPRDHWVVQTLCSMGGVATSPLSRVLTHRSASIRLLAARALAELGPDANPAIPALTTALEDSDLRVQAAALVALAVAEAPLKHLTPRLESAFKSKSPEIRSAAVEATVRLGANGAELREDVIASLRDPEESVRRTVIQNLGADFGDAVPALIPMLEDPARRSSVVEALGRIGPASKPAVPQLVKLLQSAPADERLKLISALGLIGPGASEALASLEKERTNADPAVRIASIQAAVAIVTKAPDRVALLNAGLSDSDRNVRRAISETISRLGDKAVDTHPKLIELAGNDEDREYALLALSQINLRDIAKLAALVEHPQRPVRLYAIRRLDNLGRRAKEAVPVLEQAARSSDQELARAARRALNGITLK